MKKIIKLMIFIIIGSIVLNINYQINASSDFVIEDNVLIKYNGTSTNVVVPNNVIGIGESAFANNKSIVSVQLPSSCKKLGIASFSGCSSLSEINLEYVEAISEKTFEGAGIGEIVFSDSIKEIPLGAFAYAAINTVKLGKKLQIIGDSAFFNCTNLSNFEVNDVLYSIGSRTFENCTNLKTINLGESLTSIGGRAFKGSGLTTITIPGSCKEIGNDAFNGCLSLENVIVEEGVSSIGSSAFYESNIRILNLPSTITKIEEFGIIGADNLQEINVDPNNQNYSSENGILYSKDYEQLICLPPNYQKTDVIINEKTTFVCERACSSLKNVKSVVFQEGLKTINHVAFINSISVEKIVLPNSLKEIYSGAFAYATSLYDITLPEGLEKLSDSTWNISSGVFQGCSSLISITIPESVTTMGERTFVDCSLLEEVIIKGNFTDYGKNQFGGNSQLESIIISGDNPFAFVDENGVYFEIIDNTKYLSLFPACLKLDEYTISSEITHISNQAFSCVQYLKELTIPETVTYVGDRICADSHIKVVNFNPNIIEIPTSTFAQSEVEVVNIGSHIKNIGVYAFSSTTKLKEMILPEGITTLGKYCFTDSAIKKIVMPNTVTNLDSPFVMARQLEEVVLSSGLSVIPLASFSYCESLEEVVIPENVIRIEDYAFGYCTNLKKISLPSTLVEFSSASFAESNKLEIVEINNNNQYLKEEDGIIYNSDYTKILFVTSILPEIVKLKDGITEVPAYAFTDKKGVKELYIPKSLTTINFNSFRGLSVEKVVFEEGFKTIFYNMFAQCTNLKEIEFPSTLEKIESSAFSECTSLTHIEIPDNVDINEAYSLFSNCSNLLSVKLPNSLTILPQYIFSGCTNLKQVDLPENTQKIEMYAFHNCESLKTIIIPKNVASLEINIFEGSNVENIFMLTKTAPSLKTSQFGNEYFLNQQKIYIFDDATGYTSTNYQKYNKLFNYIDDNILNDLIDLNLIDNGNNSISINFEQIKMFEYSLFQIIDDKEYLIEDLTSNSYCIYNTIGGKLYKFKLVVSINDGLKTYSSYSEKEIFVTKSEQELKLDYLLLLMEKGLVDDVDCYQDIICKYQELDQNLQIIFDQNYDINQIIEKHQLLINQNNVLMNIQIDQKLNVNQIKDINVTFSDNLNHPYTIISTNENIIRINENNQMVAIKPGKVIVQIVTDSQIKSFEIVVKNENQVFTEIIIILILGLVSAAILTTTIIFKKKEE